MSYDRLCIVRYDRTDAELASDRSDRVLEEEAQFCGRNMCFFESLDKCVFWEYEEAVHAPCDVIGCTGSRMAS